MRTVTLSLILAVVLQAGFPLAYAEKVGGPCKYKQYKGKAKITSITPKKTDHDVTALYFHEIYEVKFSFTPEQKIAEKFAQTEGREYLLLLQNSTYPGPKFLEKYDLKVGKILECNMNVITKGTCTPIHFEFPSIRLDDYFEN